MSDEHLEPTVEGPHTVPGAPAPLDPESSNPMPLDPDDPDGDGVPTPEDTTPAGGDTP